MRIAIFCLASFVLLTMDAIPALPVAEQEEVGEVTIELGCMQDGVHYEIGESYESTCEYCFCGPFSANMTCMGPLCDIPICVNDMVVKTLPGNCCPSCEMP
ncbi:hypothetical protein PoB_006004300 [Plakobranchus ocellatus]|uniref:VWFC domain-containing protein n=1 Tax=Plakobranchus ocellatus TaxID=259542 RepID=A0AAV4CNR8_9GAST|nr:hypothetical protein PoB_006004300 [Plakobranchus ocellatus]